MALPFWYKEQRNILGNGYCPELDLTNPPEIITTLQKASGVSNKGGISSGVVSPDGKYLYINSTGGIISKIDLTTYQIIWENNYYAVNNSMTSKMGGEMVVDDTETIYAGYRRREYYNGSSWEYQAGKIVAINPDGSVKWEFYGEKSSTEEFGYSVYIASDGDILGFSSDALYKINKITGQKVWRLDGVSCGGPQALVLVNGKIYLRSTGNNLIEVDEQNGSITNQITLTQCSNIFSVCSDGYNVFISGRGPGGTGGYLGRVELATWNLKWEAVLSGNYTYHLAVWPDGGYVYAIQPSDNNVVITPIDSLQIKTFTATNRVWTGGLLDKNGNILINSIDGKLYAITKDATKLWEIPFSNDINSYYFTVTTMGYLIFQTYTGVVYIYQAELFIQPNLTLIDPLTSIQYTWQDFIFICDTQGKQLGVKFKITTADQNGIPIFEAQSDLQPQYFWQSKNGIKWEQFIGGKMQLPDYTYLKVRAYTGGQSQVRVVIAYE